MEEPTAPVAWVDIDENAVAGIPMDGLLTTAK
jgi:hypothetical protein